ncbi:MAG: DNA polymerase IV, partial [Deferribacterales bacterium]
SGKTVSVYIKFKNMEGEGAMVTLPYYTSATHHIYDTVCEIIKKRFKVEYGVRLLGVSLSKLMYNSSTLINIFDDPKLEKVYMLIDKINNRYGNWTIFQGGIVECKRIGSKTISPAWRPEGVRNVEYSNL